MESIDLLRFASLCVLLAGAETLHGIARDVFVAPRLGKRRALRLRTVPSNAPATAASRAQASRRRAARAAMATGSGGQLGTDARCRCARMRAITPGSSLRALPGLD